jgi:hypothetical protein
LRLTRALADALCKVNTSLTKYSSVLKAHRRFADALQANSSTNEWSGIGARSPLLQTRAATEHVSDQRSKLEWNRRRKRRSALLLQNALQLNTSVMAIIGDQS